MYIWKDSQVCGLPEQSNSLKTEIYIIVCLFSAGNQYCHGFQERYLRKLAGLGLDLLA